MTRRDLFFVFFFPLFSFQRPLFNEAQCRGKVLHHYTRPCGARGNTLILAPNEKAHARTPVKTKPPFFVGILTCGAAIKPLERLFESLLYRRSLPGGSAFYAVIDYAACVCVCVTTDLRKQKNPISDSTLQFDRTAGAKRPLHTGWATNKREDVKYLGAKCSDLNLLHRICRKTN